MDILGHLDRVDIPSVAYDALKEQGRRAVELKDGVTYFAGHDQGVAYRFFIFQEKAEALSKIAGYPVVKPVEMVEWLRDRDHKPTERLTHLPPELLSFGDDGEVIGGQWADSYRRWKSGLDAPGMSLSKWGELSDNEVATFAEMGIFSVEQLAAVPRHKIDNRMPEEFTRALDNAIQWVAGKDVRKAANDLAAQNAHLLQEIENLKRQIQPQEPAKRGRNRKEDE
jgi:hypothetical protein